jgi:beta-fructofuranosidase
VGPDDAVLNKTIQSLPRELSLPADGILRIKPLRELEAQRFDHVTLDDVVIAHPITGHRDNVPPTDAPALQNIVELDGDAYEFCIVISREQALRKLFGFVLFADQDGRGLSIMLRPDAGTLRVGTTEAPFAVADLPDGEDVELRIFVDKYLVEVFANSRQAVLTAHMDYSKKHRLDAFSVGEKTAIKKIEIWKLKPTNQGFFDAQINPIWHPERQ